MFSARVPTLLLSSYPDGSANAPAGATIQHPGWLQGANTGTASQSPLYVKRPPWKVAGIDYPVGFSGVLASPATLPTSGSPRKSGTSVIIDTNNSVLDGYDLTLGGGFNLTFSGSPSNVTITNCNIANTAPISAATCSNMTISYCVIDGTNCVISDATIPGIIFLNPNCLLKYVWLKNSTCDLLDVQGSGLTTIQFCLFENSGIPGYGGPGSPHCDYWQSTGGPTTLQMSFSTFLQNCNGGSFSQGTYIANNQYTGATVVSNCTFRSSPGATPTGSDGNGGVQMHGWVSGLTAGATLAGGATINYNNNYADMTDCTDFAFNRTSASFSGNLNMVSGASLDVSG